MCPCVHRQVEALAPREVAVYNGRKYDLEEQFYVGQRVRMPDMGGRDQMVEMLLGTGTVVGFKGEH